MSIYVVAHYVYHAHLLLYVRVLFTLLQLFPLLNRTTMRNEYRVIVYLERI